MKRTLWKAQEVDAIRSLFHNGVDGLLEALDLLPHRPQTEQVVVHINHLHLSAGMHLGITFFKKRKCQRSRRMSKERQIYRTTLVLIKSTANKQSARGLMILSASSVRCVSHTDVLPKQNQPGGIENDRGTEIITLKPLLFFTSLEIWQSLNKLLRVKWPRTVKFINTEPHWWVKCERKVY